MTPLILWFCKICLNECYSPLSYLSFNFKIIIFGAFCEALCHFYCSSVKCLFFATSVLNLLPVMHEIALIFMQYVYMIRTRFAWASWDDSTDYELMHPEHLVRNSHLTMLCIKLWCFLSCNLKHIWTVILKMWDIASGEFGLAPLHQESILIMIS